MKQVSVKVLRLKDEFTVCCQDNQGVKEFKEQCKKLSKFPINTFDIIVAGKVLNESDPNALNTISQCKKVYIFVKSFYKNDEPDEFVEKKRIENLMKRREEGFGEKAKFLLFRGLAKDFFQNNSGIGEIVMNLDFFGMNPFDFK